MHTYVSTRSGRVCNSVCCEFLVWVPSSPVSRFSHGNLLAHWWRRWVSVSLSAHWSQEKTQPHDASGSVRNPCIDFPPPSQVPARTPPEALALQPQIVSIHRQVAFPSQARLRPAFTVKPRVFPLPGTRGTMATKLPVHCPMQETPAFHFAPSRMQGRHVAFCREKSCCAARCRCKVV
jgi:hypothetical protein